MTPERIAWLERVAAAAKATACLGADEETCGVCGHHRTICHNRNEIRKEAGGWPCPGESLRAILASEPPAQPQPTCGKAHTNCCKCGDHDVEQGAPCRVGSSGHDIGVTPCHPSYHPPIQPPAPGPATWERGADGVPRPPMAAVDAAIDAWNDHPGDYTGLVQAVLLAYFAAAPGSNPVPIAVPNPGPSASTGRGRVPRAGDVPVLGDVVEVEEDGPWVRARVVQPIGTGFYSDGEQGGRFFRKYADEGESWRWPGSGGGRG